MLFLDTRTGLALGMPAEPVDKPKRMNAARLLGDTSAPANPKQQARWLTGSLTPAPARASSAAISLLVGAGVPGLFVQEDPQPARTTVPLLRCPYWTSAQSPSPSAPPPLSRPGLPGKGTEVRDPGEGGAGDPSGVGGGVGPAGSQTHSDSLLGADPMSGTSRRTLSTTPRHTPGPRAPPVQMKTHL